MALAFEGVLFDGETGKTLAASSPQREWRSY